MALVVGVLATLSHAGGPSFIVASEVAFPGGAYRITDLALDAAGNAYLAGVIAGYDFPGVDAAVWTNGGANLRFVARVASTGAVPAFVAIVGAPTGSAGSTSEFDADEVAGLAVDGAGNAFLVAYEGSWTFPRDGGAYRATGGRKYVYKVSPSGQVARVSAALDDAIRRIGAIGVDASGAVYLTGSAGAGLATTPGARYGTASVAPGCIAPYAMKLDSGGQRVSYATYLGYAGVQGQLCTPPVFGDFDPKFVAPTGLALKVDASGNLLVTGQAGPGVMATPGSVDLGTRIPGPFRGDARILDPASHAFVAKLDPTGAIAFSARLGGSLRDRGTDLTLDPGGAVIVAGKTSSPDFPRVGPRFVDTSVFADCALWTPELGFLAKLSADGRQLLFSNYEPLDGGQLDDCGARYGGRGTRTYAPAHVALDAAGNILLAGFTDPNNREIGATPGSIIPSSYGNQTIVGRQLLEVIASDGSAALYASALPQFNVRGLAVDRWQNVIVAGEGGLTRVAPNALPVEISASPYPACAGAAPLLTVRVAGANDGGTVDFVVDGVAAGSATVTNSTASKSLVLATGVRQVKAVYHGSGPFDGYASPLFAVPVNQAGACT